MENQRVYWKITLGLYIYYKFDKNYLMMGEFINKTLAFLKIIDFDRRTPFFRAIQYEYEQTQKIIKKKNRQEREI